MCSITSAKAQAMLLWFDTAFSSACIVLKKAVCRDAGADQAQGESRG